MANVKQNHIIPNVSVQVDSCKLWSRALVRLHNPDSATAADQQKSRLKTALKQRHARSSAAASSAQQILTSCAYTAEVMFAVQTQTSGPFRLLVNADLLV